MRTRTKMMLAVGAIALGTTAMAGASLAGGGGGGHGYHAGGHHGGGWGGPRRGHGERLFERFDANEDGTITQAEIDEMRSSRLAEFDEDGDGSLTLEEYQVLWMDAMRPRMVRAFQRLDTDGDAVVTVEEFVEPFGRMVRRLDRNDDGEITQDDLRRRPRDRDRGDNDD
jgi:Ca2+-binding EF-hand superfamily protein